MSKVGCYWPKSVPTARFSSAMCLQWRYFCSFFTVLVHCSTTMNDVKILNFFPVLNKSEKVSSQALNRFGIFWFDFYQTQNKKDQGIQFFSTFFNFYLNRFTVQNKSKTSLPHDSKLKKCHFFHPQGRSGQFQNCLHHQFSETCKFFHPQGR